MGHEATEGRTVAIEFKPVDLILSSDAPTRAVDAFALSLIKAEKQVRRLVTYLVFQHSWCNDATVPALKTTLAASKKVYFGGLLGGWDHLYPRTVEQLVGARYGILRARLNEAARHRNKIFHGQLTGEDLSRPALDAFVKDIRQWCETLGVAAQTEVEYNGCGNSFRKAADPAALRNKYKARLPSLAAYRQLIVEHMEPSPGPGADPPDRLTARCSRR